MKAAGYTLTLGELIGTRSVTPVLAHSSIQVWVADADGDPMPVTVAENDCSSITLTVDDPLDLAARVDALTELIQDIANSNDKGSKMTKQEIIAACVAIL